MFGESNSYSDMSDEERNYFVEILREEMSRRERSGKPEQIREIVPMEEFLTPYYLGDDAKKIFPYWKEFLCDMFDPKREEEGRRINTAVLSGCFTGDTKVSLLDGREVSFEDLEKEYGVEGYFWVYSCDKNSNVVPGLAHNVHKTKVAKKLCVVTLDNGEVIKCTPDHLFLTRSGEYKRADNLQENESLMPSDNKNYKVKSIEIIDADEWVYDLEVDAYHNFALSSGVFVHNSIGTGKSTVAEIILLRKLYEISCYKNINAFFGLMASATITFIYFSLNKATALATGFSSIRAWVDNSTYFAKNFPRRKRLDSLLVFPEGVTIAYGSRATASTGRNVLCSIMDEANFINSMGDNTSGNIEMAVEMFTGLVNRSNSRFILQGGDNHSLNILVSSSTHNNSATERIIRASQDDVHAIVATPAQWDVKPNNFSKEFFYVLKGTKYMEPQIIKSTDDVNSFRIAEGLPKSKFVDNLEDFDAIEKEIQKLPPYQQDNFLKVPIDLKRGFEMNIIRSLQDMGGVSTGATGKLFNSPAVFDACIDERLAHPFIQQEIIISTGDQIEIKDYMRNNFRFKNIERPRFIHIDQSYRTDSTGISCVYVSDVMIDEETGARKPIFSTDFMLRINPPKPPRKIAIYKIRNFVVYLANVMGVKIGKVTYDIFNSEESRQILEEMGFNVGYQSVDRNDEAYLSLVEIMYEGRLKFYDYPILRHEIFNLIHNREKRKVDHPKTVNDSIYNGKGENVGSKDCSDSLAGAVYSALKESIVDEVDERRTLNDFLLANQYNSYLEADAFSAEEMINKEIDDMIEQMEMSGFTYGDLGGVRGF